MIEREGRQDPKISHANAVTPPEVFLVSEATKDIEPTWESLESPGQQMLGLKKCACNKKNGMKEKPDSKKHMRNA